MSQLKMKGKRTVDKAIKLSTISLLVIEEEDLVEGKGDELDYVQRSGKE